eukprot:CAMPEP_0174743214 /NCGR_PEP_ID=MMETSP1094-20130205/81027_1 /TAXON_ID=156173 /ORGANISM="Chrysochromulina brevifilum, Strain UTEX LB 985" /LENGTH=59 /DNA_ID=CAMNT_0015947397 /DNA_START=123 /DNA_END=299 /DNA_ORIENTATION=-
MIQLGTTALIDLGLRRGAAPSGPPARVLICGDADYCYACALATRLSGAVDITATAYEDE